MTNSQKNVDQANQLIAKAIRLLTYSACDFSTVLRLVDVQNEIAPYWEQPA